MNCIKALSLLRTRGLWPCVVAGLCLGHAMVQAQGASGSAGPSAPAVVSAPSLATPSDAPPPAAVGAAVATPATAQPASPPPVTSPVTGTALPPLNNPHKPAVARDTRPTWAELTRPQQEALRPLAQAWPGLSELHKRKWLVLTQNYADFSPQEQHKLQQRMSDWASLTARERAQARLHFAEVQQLPGDERRAKWEAYQALSDEQRRKLADDILLAPPRGAALASRPVAPSKLTQAPAPKPDQVLQPRIDTDQVHPKTLLPHSSSGTSTR